MKNDVTTVNDLLNDNIEVLKENITYLELISRLQQWDKLMYHINWRSSDDLDRLREWKNKSRLEQLSEFEDAVESYKSIVCAVDENYCNILYTTLMWGCPVYAYLLLQMSGIEVNKTNNAGWTALMQASCFGQQTIVKILLTKPDIDVNARSCIGDTALMLATNNGHKEIVQRLIHFADTTLDTMNNAVKSATQLAEEKGYTGIANMIRDQMQKPASATGYIPLYVGATIKPHLHQTSLSYKFTK